MFDIKHKDMMEFDFFRELENIGVSHAATALSVLLSRSVTIRVPRAELCEYSEICNFLHGPENVVAALLVGISADINGYILLVLDENDARILTETVVGNITDGMSEAEKTEIEISALKEAANMVIGAYITAISELTRLKIDASVPELVFDMAGAVMNLLAVTYGETSDHALFMETEFCEETQSLFGHFFLIPDMESYQKLIQKMVNF